MTRSGLAGGALARIVGADLEALAGAAARASHPQRTPGAGRAKGGDSGAADQPSQPVGAGRAVVGVVDDEIIDGEPARVAPAHRCGLDPVKMAALSQFGAELPSAISGISQHRHR